MGIKSFQGSRKQQSSGGKVLDAHIRVRDYMSTNLITFKPQDSIDHVIGTLIKNRISGGPVVNEKNELVGIVSEGDCIKHVRDSQYYNMPSGQSTVAQVMAENVETIDGNMDIFDAANKFLNSKRRRFPILEDGKLVGQISQKDVLKAAASLKGQTWNV